MSLSTIGFGDMVPGSYPHYNIHESKNITIWFCSCYIMSGMALTAMCFNILHDEIVHRLNHQNEKQEPVKTSSSVDELTSTDPFALTSWQFPSSNLCHRNVTEESLCGDPPVSIFAHENEINILKDSYNQVDVTRDCKPILKLEDHISHLPSVYTLPEVDEEAEENTEM